MTHLTELACLLILILGLGSSSSFAREPEGRSIRWQPVTLPGPFMKWNQEVANQTKFVWARREFQVTPAQARRLAVLRWNRIASGATAFINGRKVGENEPTGPFQVVLPESVLRLSGDAVETQKFGSYLDWQRLGGFCGEVWARVQKA